MRWHWSWPRLRAQIVKELLSVLRDPRSRALLVGPPLMQLLIFSFAATLEVRNVTLAVFDRDGGPAAQALRSDLAAARFVGRVITVHSPAALAGRLERREALLALDIPPTFSRDIAAGRPAALQVLADGRRANSAQVAVAYVEAVVAGTGATLRQPLSAAPGTAPDAVAVRHLFNPNLVYQWFVVPGLSGILAMLSALIVPALSIARERELGTFDQLLVSPTTPAEIIVAKSVPALLLGTALGLVMVGAGVALFGIPFRGSFALLLGTLVLFILSVIGIGLAISSVCATQQQAILGTFAAAVPMILMSGFATPVENMPPALQWLAEAIPLRHYLVVVQGSFLKAMPLADVLAHVWPLALIAGVTLTVSAIVVRGRLQ